MSGSSETNGKLGKTPSVGANSARPKEAPDAKSAYHFFELQPGTYKDGRPLDQVHFVECKVILKPDRFTSARALLEYGDVMSKAAKAFGIVLNRKGIVLKPQIREVLFLDTEDFRLYNHACILRRRTSYVDGFPAGDPEIVLKYRHPDIQKAAEVDVRPNIAGRYRIKFKAEALPLKDQIGGYRLLYSHNAVLGLSQLPQADQTSMKTMARIFPCLSRLKKSPSDHIGLVNQTIVEEVLQDLGTLEFGRGVTAAANISLWRERGMHRPLCGEVAFQVKFERGEELRDKGVERGLGFFIELQQTSRDWLLLGTTKTGMVYRQCGNPPQGHE